MAKRLNYEIGFTGDTRELEAALNRATEALNNLGKNRQFTLTSELQKATVSASELERNLKAAYNADTGKLDLSVFQRQLDQSGKDLKTYAADLQKLGPEGEEAFFKVAAAITQAELPMRRSNKLLNELWVTMKNTARWQLTSSALHGFMGAVQTAYGYTQDLNESLNSIRIVTGKSTEDMAKFADEANRAAKELSTTTTNYTDASLIYYQQGLDDEAVRARTDVTIKLANAAGESAEKASQQMTAIWNNFAEGSENLEYYADVLTALGASTASSTEEISAGLQKFAGVAQTVGLSYEYAAAALATITATTRESAETVGTALRTLFGRLEGLKLGETLDDGTDLNKYSAALMSIGVNIKDSSGELKDMDQILDETMEKWETLTRDQQVALAQTVAGVRQYAQFITLMDQSDFFRSNVETAESSTGTLTKQANIYAESWEAARKRVKAASEDIYDSLINEDFFIGFDKGLATILTRIADIIDGMGGMGGVLSTVAVLMNKVYGDRIAQSMRDIRTNLGFINQQEQERARSLQSITAQLIENLNLAGQDDTAEGRDLQILQTKIKLQDLYNQNVDKLTDQERQLLEIDKQRTENLLKQAEYFNQQSGVAQGKIELAEDKLIGAAVQITTNDFISRQRDVAELSNKYKDLVLGAQDAEEATRRLIEETKNIASARAPFTTLHNLYEQLERSTIDATEKVKQFQEAAKTLGLESNFAHLKDWEEIGNILSKSFEQAQNKIDEIVRLAGQLKLPADAIRSIAANASLSAEQIAALQQKLKEAGIEIDLTSQKLQTNGYALKDWANAFIQAGSALSQLTMGINAINSLIDTFSNTDLSGVEKFTRSLASLGMILPLIAKALPGLKTLGAMAATSFFGPAWTALAGGVAVTTISFEALMPVLVLVIAALYAIIKVIDSIPTSFEKANEAINSSIEAFNESKNTVNSLTNELKTLQDRINELKDQGPLTIIEENELRTLEAQAASVERRLEAEKHLQEIRAKTVGKQIENNYQATAGSLESKTLVSTLIGSRDSNVSRLVAQLQTASKQGRSEREGLENWYNQQQIELSGNEIALNELKETYQEYLQKLDEIEQENSEATLEILETRENQLTNYLEAIENGATRDEDTIKELIENIDEVYEQLYNKNPDLYNEKRLLPLLELKSVMEAFKTGDFSTNELAEDLERAAVPAEKLKGFLNDLYNTLIYDENEGGFFKSAKDLNAFLERIGSQGFEILASLNLADFSNVEELENEINERIKQIQETIDVNDKYRIQLPLVTSTLENLEAGKAPSEKELETLKELEAEYPQLALIRDRTSNEYIQALRDIREGMEKALALDALKELDAAWEQLKTTIDTATDGIVIDIDDEEFSKKMSEIMDADYAVQVKIEADLESDYQDAISHSAAIEKAAAAISTSFQIAADDIDAVQRTFPGILAGYTVTADGMIQLNAEVAQSAIDLAKNEVESEVESARARLQAHKEILLSKAESMRTIAEGLSDLLALEIQASEGEQATAEDTARAKEKIEEGILKFKDASAKEEALISEAKTHGEINDANEVLSAQDNAATTTANNWRGAYDSMIKNSATWARNSIINANKVGLALKNAANAATTGKFVASKLDVASSGGSLTRFSGGFSEHVYAGSTFESTNPTLKDWSDYYDTYSNAKSSKARILALQSAIAAAEAEARTFEAAAANIDAHLANLDASGIKVKNAKPTASKGSKSGSGSKSKELKELDEFDTRYHEINEEIEKQDRLLKKIDTDIDRAYGTEKLEKYQKSIEALNGQAENYLAKSREAAEYLEIDFKRAEAAAQKFGASLTIGEEGDILNYTDVLRNAYLQLSKVHASQNEEAYNQAKENFDNLKKLMDQYVETLKIQRENFDAYEDKRREIRDQELKNITYKLEVAIDIKQLRQDIRDFSKEIEESFGDALTHGLKVFDLNTEQAKEEMAMYDTYLQQYNELKDYWANDDSYSSMEDTREAMKNLISEIINSGGNLLDWIDYWENMVPEAINAARERFDQFTNQLKHNTTILDSIKELYALQGQTYKTVQGFERLQRTASEKVNASLTNAMLNRDWYERTKVNLLDAQKMLDSLNGDESDVRWDAFKKNRDALLKEFNDAEEAYLASAKEAMETAKDMYLEQIEKAAYDFAQALAKTGDLNFLSQQYDHFINQEERYLDAVNTAYEKQNWWNKIEQDINNSTNKAHQEKLKLFYEEEVVQRSLNGLNKYDLDIIEAKYKVMQAQMALEDAQNAKNNLRLVRDRQGNWNYQYTADQAEIDNANSELADAENEWYNIAKQQVKDVTGQIIDTWKEAQEAIKEVYNDMTLTDEERAARATEIYDYYCQKIKDLEREKQVSVKDMTEAGQIVLEDFSTSYIDTLNGMSTSNQDFTVALQDYMDQCRENMREYQDTVHEVAVESSTDLEHLDQKLDDTTEANNRLRETGLRTVDQLQNSITTVYNTAMAYQELAQSIMETVRAMQELAGMQARDIENMSRGGSGDYDHSLAMIQAAQNGDWDTYATEARLHDAKAAANGMGNVWSSDQISALIYAAQKENDASAIALLNQIGNGAYFTDDYWDNWNNAGQNLNDATDRMVDLLEALYSSASGATGMYTGTWNNNGGRLAFLHQKELVLNQDDTKNILDAVAMVRNSFEQRSFEISGLMASRIGNIRPVIPVDPDPRVSTNYFDVSFPNATSHIEIEQAIRNLADDATQFVNIQKQ